jgi:Heavy metal binding domain
MRSVGFVATAVAILFVFAITPLHGGSALCAEKGPKAEPAAEPKDGKEGKDGKDGKDVKEGAAKVEPKVIKIGKVRWYKKSRRIEVDGYFSYQDNLLEFLAVIKGGKEYESLLVFDCKAIDINLALIGAGYRASGGVRKKGDPGVPKGDPLYLSLEWKTDAGKTKRIRAEDVLFNRATKKPMRKTAWVFSGSSFVKVKNPKTKKSEYRYLADEYRMLIAIWRDPAAIFNNPLDTGEDDAFYIVNEKAIPKPVKFICPRHPEVSSRKPGKCSKCEIGTPLIAVGRPVTLIMEPAPKDALKPENLKDGGHLLKTLEAGPEPSMGPGASSGEKKKTPKKPSTNAEEKPPAK